MKKARSLVMTGFGLNCDNETDHCFRLAGAESDKVHLTDAYDRNVKLSDYHILAFIGGFAQGDENGAGVVLADDFKSRLWDDLMKFVTEDKGLIIGICNGYQAITKMGLLPGFNGDYGQRSMSVTYNDCGNFRDQWVSLIFNDRSPCVFTKGLRGMELPIRHGEGKVVPRDEALLEYVVGNNHIAAKYADPETGMPAGGAFPANPNGSVEDIAGICDHTGRVFGLMPHPEAYNHFTNHYQWTRKKNEMKGKGEWPPESTLGDGVKIFRNAVKYVEDTLL
jgi:phosphoribosylformylglycinamidine synthase